MRKHQDRYNESGHKPTGNEGKGVWKGERHQSQNKEGNDRRELVKRMCKVRSTSEGLLGRKVCSGRVA